MTVRALCFWSGLAGAGWVLVGYPATLLFLPRRPWLRNEEETPSVTILVAAYRERQALRRKLTALRDIDYPSERLQVVVAVDEDPELAGIARQAWPTAEVLFSQQRGGKAAALNRGLAASTGDIVILTDANNVLDRESLRAAVRHFAEPSVWVVAGRRGEAGSAYERYEHAIRRLESLTGSVAAISGEFIAARRDRVREFPEDAVVDDFWLLCDLVRQGGRAVYEGAASSTEPALNPRDEFTRRSRMGAGIVMLLPELSGLPPGFTWRVLSHKVGRLMLPFALLSIFLSSLSLSRRPFYRACAATQVVGYSAGALAAAGFAPPGRAGTAMRGAGQFFLGNVAIGAGVVRALRRRQDVLWGPVESVG